MATNVKKQQTLKAREKAAMSQVVREILEDPDFGLELSEVAKKRLTEVVGSKQRTKSATEIKRKYY